MSRPRSVQPPRAQSLECPLSEEDLAACLGAHHEARRPDWLALIQQNADAARVDQNHELANALQDLATFIEQDI